MGEFLGKLSIAEAMGDLFGRHVRIITAICGFIGIAGVIAIQFQVAGKLTHYAFGIEEKYGIIIAAINRYFIFCSWRH
jgi:Na+/proline symporter